MRRKQFLVLGGVVICFGLIVVAAYKLTHHADNVNLVISPSVASAKLDGTKVEPGKLYLKPGRHTVTASFSGFQSQTVSFTASSTFQTVNVYLPANSDGLQWLLAHPEEQNARQTLGGQAFHDASQDRLAKTPLIKQLPYYERYFSVTYGQSQKNPNDDSAVAIYITFFAPQGKQQALDWITQQGYQPSTLEILYVDQTGTAVSPDT